VEWSRERSVGCRKACPSPELRRWPRGGEDWAVGDVSAGGSARMRRAMPRAAAGAQILALRIGQTGPRPKKFAAPRRMQRLLGGRFRAPAMHIGGLYSARPI
jgi:hypothetical protein